MNTKTMYKLLEVIELPENTSVHMLNGKDYKINKDGELVSQDGYKLPISKKNIDTCEFTIIEEKRNYNFRVYKDGMLVDSIIHYGLIKVEVQVLLKDLYYANGGFEYKLEPIIGNYEFPRKIPYGNDVEVVAEEIVK
jgi:hypothetical protein